METLLIGGLAQWGSWKYLLLFVAMFLQGDITLFAAGFLIEQGFFDPFVALLIMFSETMLGDSLYYYLGWKFKDSTFLPLRIIHKISRPMDQHLRKYFMHTLLLSKFTVGLHRALVFRVGAIDTPFKKFIKTNLLASVLWILGVGALGYASGASFELVKGYVRYAEVGLLIALIGFVVFTHFVIRKPEEAAVSKEAEQAPPIKD